MTHLTVQTVCYLNIKNSAFQFVSIIAFHFTFYATKVHMTYFYIQTHECIKQQLKNSQALNGNFFRSSNLFYISLNFYRIHILFKESKESLTCNPKSSMILEF